MARTAQNFFRLRTGKKKEATSLSASIPISLSDHSNGVIPYTLQFYKVLFKCIITTATLRNSNGADRKMFETEEYVCWER